MGLQPLRKLLAISTFPEALCSLCVGLFLQFQNLFVAQFPVIHPPSIRRSPWRARLRALTPSGTLPVLPSPRRGLRSGFSPRPRITNPLFRRSALPSCAERRRRPTPHHPLHRSRHQLLCPRINHSHHLSPRGIVKSPRPQNLCHLLAHLRVALQSRFYILAHRRAQSFLQRNSLPRRIPPRAIQAPQIRQRLLHRSRDRPAHTLLQLRIRRLLKIHIRRRNLRRSRRTRLSTVSIPVAHP